MSGPAKAWCATCRGRREVADVSIESAVNPYPPYLEVDYHVTTLVCGHETSAKTGTTRTTPGPASSIPPC